MTVGDIIVAAEETAARQAAAALSPAPSSNTGPQGSIPSPPQTSTVVSMEVMQNPGTTLGATPSPNSLNDSQVFPPSDMGAEIRYMWFVFNFV